MYDNKDISFDMPDLEVVESKLNFLREYRSDLKEYEAISLSEYGIV